MKFQSLTPMLWVDDLKATIAFYVDVLGFTLDGHSEEWGWAQLRFDDVQIMFSLPNKHMPYTGPGFTGSFYFNTVNVAEYWEKIKDSTRILYPLEDFYYGMREFAIYDCNGYILQFGESVNT